MKVRFRPPAAQEFEEAYSWYEQQLPGLGKKFKASFQRSVFRLQQFPFANADLMNGVRRAQLSGFPYAVWYAIEDNHLMIYAVAHTHRKPFYWIDR